MSGNGKEVVDVPAPKNKARKPKQEHLPGQEPVKIAAVHNAIEAYVEARDERMKLTVVEVQKRTLLMEIMKKHGITTYAVDGHLADIESEEKIKARLKDEEDEPEMTQGEDIEKEREKIRALKPGKKRGKDAAAGADA